MAAISGTMAWSTNASKPNTSLRSEDAASGVASPVHVTARSVAAAAARHGRREPSSQCIATVPIAATNGSAGVRCGNISSERVRCDFEPRSSRVNGRANGISPPPRRRAPRARRVAAVREGASHGRTRAASTRAPSSAPPVGSAPPESSASLAAAYGTSLGVSASGIPARRRRSTRRPRRKRRRARRRIRGKSDSHVARAKRADRTSSSDANAFATSRRRVAYLGSGVLANSSRAKASMAASAGETSSADESKGRREGALTR